MIAPLLDSTRECDAIACTHAPLYNIISALRTLDIRSILPFPLSPFPATYLTLFRAGYNEAVEMTSEVTVTKILALGRNGGVKNHLVGTKRKREKIEEILPVITPKYKLIVSTRQKSLFNLYRLLGTKRRFIVTHHCKSLFNYFFEEVLKIPVFLENTPSYFCILVSPVF